MDLIPGWQAWGQVFGLRGCTYETPFGRWLYVLRPPQPEGEPRARLGWLQSHCVLGPQRPHATLGARGLNMGSLRLGEEERLVQGYMEQACLSQDLLLWGAFKKEEAQPCSPPLQQEQPGHE